jgi:hypothetical protein
MSHWMEAPNKTEPITDLDAPIRGAANFAPIVNRITTQVYV